MSVIMIKLIKFVKLKVINYHYFFFLIFLIIISLLGRERYEFAKELLAKGTTNVRNENILSNKEMNKSDKSN
jgi:hypothetical protein